MDDPVDEETLAGGAALPGRAGAHRAGRARRGLRPSGAPGSRCAGWGRGGGSTPGRSTPPVVERYLVDGQRSRLTQAALETLAVIAYRQPVTRARVSAIRGVGVDGVMRTLLTRGLVHEVGTDPDSGGGLYATTPLFLERLGLTGLADLPELAPLLPETVVDARRAPRQLTGAERALLRRRPIRAAAILAVSAPTLVGVTRR